MKLIVDGRTYEVQSTGSEISVNGTRFPVKVEGTTRYPVTVYVGSRSLKVEVQSPGSPATVLVDGKMYDVTMEGSLGTSSARPERPTKVRGMGAQASNGAIKALMPGKVIAITVREGDEVAAGAVLMVIEAMKMENEVHAPRAGRVKAVIVAPGSNVNGGDLLAVLE